MRGVVTYVVEVSIAGGVLQGVHLKIFAQ